MSCSVIETIETRLELILLAVKFTVGGFDESVLDSSECRRTCVLPWYWGYWEYTNMMQIIPFQLE